jgi:hypothetical protein
MKNRQENPAMLQSLSRLSGQALPGRLSQKCRYGASPGACGAWTDSLARETGSTLGTPYSLYTPGWYMRGY